MERNLLILPDGTELSSGLDAFNAIKAVAFSESVNSGPELNLGSLCASCLEVSLIAPRGGLTIRQGTEVTYCKVDEAGNRTQIGVFICEKPSRITANAYRVTAYDRVTKLDKDLSDWLRSLTGWPYSVLALASMVCTQCGVDLIQSKLPNGAYPVQKFYSDGITGRLIMQWAGQITGSFCRATADGRLELAWYSDRGGEILPTGEASYFTDGLSYEDYQVAPIDKVQIRNGSTDVGVIYPADASGANTYVIEDNLLLTASSDASLRPVAQAIYGVLAGVTYTPCRVAIRANLAFRAGDIVRITDANGTSITTYVMSRKQTGQKVVLGSTGSASRSSTSAVNSLSMKELSGKVLNVQATIDGLKVENRQRDEKYAQLVLDVDGISTEVASVNREISQIKQDSNSISLRVEALDDELNTMYEGTVAALELYVQKDDNNQIVSMLNASADEITLKSNRLSIDSTNFKLTKEGKLTAQSGTIGGWTITGDRLQAGGANGVKVCAFRAPSDGVNWVIAIGGSSHSNYGDSPFRVNKDGKLYATGAEISGKITATSGSFKGTVESSSATITGGSININTSDEKTSLISLNGTTQKASMAPNGFRATKTDAAVEKYTHMDYEGITILSGGTKTTLSHGGVTEGSDRRLKEDITYIDGNAYVEFVRELKPCTFRYIGSDQKIVGLIAQDVEDNMTAQGVDFHGYSAPDERNPYRSLNYAAFVTPIIYALQNALDRIERLEESA